MKSTGKLKEQIKKKFRTFSNFSRVVGIDRYEMQRVFIEKDEVDPDTYTRFKTMYDSFQVSGLRNDQIAEMKERISEMGGMSKFCRKYGFSRRSVYSIMNKESIYKGSGMTPLVKRVLDALQID